MKKHEWQKYFTPIILSRGLDYFKDNLVEDLDWNQDTRTLSAIVQGSMAYNVEIKFESDSLAVCDMWCDCPYAEEGSDCKHMAAVLYEFSRYANSSEFNSAETSHSEKTKPIAIKEAIEKLSETEAKAYLLECAKQDENLCTKIILRVQPTVTPEQQRQWKQELNRIARIDQSDYIEEDTLYDYEQALEEFLQIRIPILLEKGLTAEAFNLICDVYNEYRAYDLDDFCHSSLGLPFICDAYWYNVISAAEPSLKRQIFDWFVEHYDDNELFDIITTAFEETEYLTQILSLIDDDIAKTPEMKEYIIVSLLQCRCDIMERLNISEEEQRAYRRRFFHIRAVREAEVKWLESKRFVDEAIALARESRELDDKNSIIWTQHLLELLRQSENTDEYKKELREYVLNNPQSNLNYIHDLKRLMKLDEWSAMLDEILRSNNLYDTEKYDFLFEEKLFEQLFNELTASRNISYIWKYEKSLRSHYPIEIRGILTNLLNNEMEFASSRNQYKDIIAKLPIISAYPDGEEIAEHIVVTWANKYARRKAMLDELRKAGY